MGSAQSFTERRAADQGGDQEGLGTAGRKYNIDESYTEWIIGVNGPRGAKAAGVPISDRHEAGVLERILDLAAIPARMHAASRGGFWVYVPKIVRAS